MYFSVIALNILKDNKLIALIFAYEPYVFVLGATSRVSGSVVKKQPFSSGEPISNFNMFDYCQGSDILTSVLRGSKRVVPLRSF